MSEWTHPVCDSCWARHNPRREPVRLIEREDETCCNCGTPTRAGIYVRQDAASLRFCPGVHD